MKTIFTTAKNAVLEAGAKIKEIILANELVINIPLGTRDVHTNVDIIAEKIIRTKILEVFPSHSFKGEELGLMPGDSEYLWICDPVDGTWAMINGEYTFAVSLALKYKNKTIAAFVYNPMLDHFFSATDEENARFNDMKIPFEKASGSGLVLNYQIDSMKIIDIVVINGLIQTRKIRKAVSTGGSPAYNLALVAAGIHSAFVVSGKSAYNDWDIAAGIYLVEKVGGKVDIFSNGMVLIASTNERIQNMLIAQLSNVNFGQMEDSIINNLEYKTKHGKLVIQ